jgi:hypothetical protein
MAKTFDSAKQSKPHTVSRSTVKAGRSSATANGSPAYSTYKGSNPSKAK